MEPQYLEKLKTKMQKALEVLIDDLATIRTGHANPSLVENILISAYDNTQHLKVKEMATITTEGPRIVIISPFDLSVVKDLERGLQAANLGVTVAVDGNVIRIVIPPLTFERREEFIKLAHNKLEGSKIMVRQIRHEAMALLKRKFEAKEIAEDDKKSYEKDIQKLTDEMMMQIEVIGEKKEKELNQI